MQKVNETKNEESKEQEDILQEKKSDKKAKNLLVNSECEANFVKESR